MKKVLLLLCLLFLTVACISSKAVSDYRADQNTNISEVENKPENIPTKVSIDLKFDKKQSQILNKSLPSNVRDIIENAEEFQLLGEIERKDGKVVYPITEGRQVKPNIKADISDSNIKKEILENFYRDVAKGSEAANCWQPHHILRARRGDKNVEIEICFSCSRFEGKGAFGEFSGTTGRGDEKTENLFNHILATQGVEIK